ncbi:MAG: M48 family metallopeptidase [Candidatus Electrothrix sp. Rat3]|nr:M48 family metallopeptidase [Candidatus Electrothrix rattekaaiensis]
MMTDEKYNALLSQSEDMAKNDPSRYRRKMRFLILLGDLYLAAIILVLLGLLLGSLFLLVRDLWTGALGWQTALAVPVLLSAVWLTRMLLLMKGGRKPIPGIPVSQEQAPELYAMIDTLCAQADVRPLRRVLITNEFNASVDQLPRLGVFGWHRKTLLLGLPLLKSMTVEQFKAVLAHELGHLVKQGDAAASRRVHYQMIRWTGLAETLGDDPHGWLFKHFLEWFIPYCTAWALPQARMSEFEADALSVRLVSYETVVETLSLNHVIDGYLEQLYWPAVLKLAEQHPEPSFSPYERMGGNLCAALPDVFVEYWLGQSMQVKTELEHTHPCLRERFEALQASPRIVLAQAGKTAEGLLGSGLQPVAQQMDKEWQDGIRSWWTEQYEKARKKQGQPAE